MVQIKGDEFILNLPLLKGKLREHDKTYADLANVIGKSVTTVNAKINGRIAFNCAEAFQISQWLKLTNEEKTKIFLN